MDNIARAEMFCNIINDINYKIKAPKYLLEPINEILKMDKKTNYSYYIMGD